MNNLIKTIDNEIYKLHGLSNEDIEIIESKEYIIKFLNNCFIKWIIDQLQ